MIEIPFKPCPQLCTILPLQPLRKTAGVSFESIPEELLRESAGAERVIHEHGAHSPGEVGDVKHPWYCHKEQDDHLLVLAGSRHVELFIPGCEKVFSFLVTADAIYSEDMMLYQGGAILRWRAGVFHRIESSPLVGSASLNLAIRHEGFDIRHEFDIYDLDIQTGKSWVIRDGYLDQK